MKEHVNYWVELSEYDIETAEAMLESGRYLYVGFMCHQSTEKILKALFTSVNQSPPPYTHSLSYLAEKSNLLGELSDLQVKFINSIEPLNIEARYPSHKKELMKSLGNERCKQIINETKEFIKWVKTKL